MKRAAILWIGLLATLVAVNMTVWRYEKLRLGGAVVLLELAPKDPRSLMQGDYMALRLAVSRDVADAQDSAPATPGPTGLTPEPTTLRAGFVIVRPDASNVGRFVRIQAGVQPHEPTEVALPFRLGAHGVEVVTTAFFFEEGRAKDFDAARYGEFRVDETGLAILTGLRDERMQPL
jgi:uncharacterized membrane-anchored protein